MIFCRKVDSYCKNGNIRVPLNLANLALVRQNCFYKGSKLTTTYKTLILMAANMWSPSKTLNIMAARLYSIVMECATAYVSCVQTILTNLTFSWKESYSVLSLSSKLGSAGHWNIIWPQHTSILCKVFRKYVMFMSLKLCIPTIGKQRALYR